VPGFDEPSPWDEERKVWIKIRVLAWLREGKTGPEVAIILNCARRTVESHVAKIYRKLGVRHRDFSDREVQLLHLLGQHVGVLSRRIEERRHLQTAWTALAAALASVSDLNRPDGSSVPTLGIKDGRILSGLVRGESRADIAAALNWRRDTLDRHLGSLRERLGYENTSQLMQSLAALRASRPDNDPTASVTG
jgi:DNA-binding CsgD family transcriptional regulator